MTYQDFRRLALDATEIADFDRYIAEVGGSVPETVPDAQVIGLLADIHAYANDRTAQMVRTIAGMSRTDFARAYNIPYRTAQNWETDTANARTAPDYLLDLLAYAVIADKRIAP